ncbi:MAG: MoaD/ThiS family protein [Promethearchaeota archaeon]|nr:MAG: MoaD/ThiS family protein [Candidatus Lokiarchaeota archaeon]
MIKIKISFLSLLADIINEEEIILSIKEDSTIKDALIILSSKFGNLLRETIFTSSETLNNYIILGLNGKDIRTLDNLNTLLHHGDEISFLPAIAGG